LLDNGRGLIEMMKTRENTWPNRFVLGILQFLIGIFCGSLIGLLVGAFNWAIVFKLRYPFAASTFDVLVGACIGVSFGFFIGVVAGVLPRGWPAGLLLSLVSSVSASHWLISQNWLNSAHSQPDDASLCFGIPTVCLTAVIWFLSGWLVWLAVRKMIDAIRIDPRGHAAIAYYCALSLFYLALGGYWIFYYFSYLEYGHRY
jgi:hypothetical protein